MHYVYVNFPLTNYINFKRYCKFKFLISVSKKIKFVLQLANITLEVGKG